MLDNYNITQTTLKVIGLYTNDYKKSLHIREIARKTDVDVKSIQIQLKKLEKINILSSVIRGKNKEFSLNQNIITRYYLIMAECFAVVAYLKRHFLIKKIFSELDSHIDGTVILFGSYAKGTYTKQSDIDLFVIDDKRVDKKIISKTSDMINRDINIKSSNRQQFLNRLYDNDPLVKEVVSNHVILKGADEFCQIMWRNYAS
ncbi:putative nucleotidyl transferase protein [Marine Group I thaumarchaeote SCGC AAA799-E16]|uniref:DNA polymerase subunit beta protein n=4 Tax=Marine Group I TaxID=905826 RepID=A0A087RQL9_9ARCH|nr:putative nucleotidyl transferase protein [Marine Group I thaumarchaeote SCGC AAA799-N04]KER05555.1 putative nucleotidyl transferase protein [Marine Group I thaumarchaeote SCGC AAA799-E16]KFM15610.1 putative nucleotidyl transferase protein [Marine Group I thaumarchaeote SCGC AAA799-D11]KFM15773.1 DNA polymerase subunit beta protein [Marine Group I thaumarchaeote SCGC RSA3]